MSDTETAGRSSNVVPKPPIRRLNLLRAYLYNADSRRIPRPHSPTEELPGESSLLSEERTDVFGCCLRSAAIWSNKSVCGFGSTFRLGLENTTHDDNADECQSNCCDCEPTIF